MENKRFYRSTTSNYIGGVCGGLAEYFNVDPVLVRVIFVLLALYGGGGVLIYIILWVVIPRKPFDAFSMPPPGYTAPGPATETFNADQSTPKADPYPIPQQYSKGSLLVGLLLVTLGILFLIDRLIPGINFRDLWPILLIVIGIFILAGSLNRKKKDNEL